MKRIYHTWDKWECYPAGFYENRPREGGETADQLMAKYAAFLSDEAQFRAALLRVISEWKHSCEHYLTNECMNRIAWLGQASACLALGIPSVFCGGFNILSEDQQKQANALALWALNEWRGRQGESQLTEEEAQSQTEMNLY